MPIYRTSNNRERQTADNEDNRERDRILTRKPVERATELLLVVHRTSQEQTLARLFFLVWFIISPRGNPPHHTLE